MAFRATGGMSCGSTATVLSYNKEGHLTAWQNKPSSPTSADSFLYYGEGIASPHGERWTASNQWTLLGKARIRPSPTSKQTHTRAVYWVRSHSWIR